MKRSTNTMPVLRSTVITVIPPTALDTVIGRVFDPPTEAAETLGNFIVLLNVEDIPSLVSWAEPFVSFLEQTYYRAAEGDGMTIERAVSLTHQKARAKLRQVERERHPVGGGTIHYVLGAMHAYDMALCHSGSPEAYLLHQLSGSVGRPRYRWVNITTVDAPPSQRTALAAATIVSGTVGRGDTVFISTQSVAEAVSLEKLQGTIGELPMAGSKTILTQQFMAIGGRRSYCVLLLRPMEDMVTARAPESVTGSMKSLTTSEHGTSSLLTPVGSSRLKRLWLMVVGWFTDRRRPRERPPVSGGIPHRRPDILAANIGWRIGQTIRRLGGSLIRAFTIGILTTLRTVILLPTSAGRAAVRESLHRVTDRWLQRTVAWLRSLPRPAERLLIIALLFGFLFVQSLVFLAERRTRETAINTSNHTVVDIQTALDRAESDIVFGNDAEATTLLAQAEELLTVLPQRTRDERQHWQLLMGAIADVKKRLERAVTVEEPQAVAPTTAGLFTQPDGLIFTGTGLLLYRGENNTFALTDLATKTTVELPVTAANIGRLTHGLLDGHGRLVFLHRGKGLAVLDLTTHSLTNDTIDEAPTEPKAAAFYGNRLYLLDPNQQQIWRYQPTAAGYGGRRPWVREAVPSLRRATSLIVEGSVYFLTDDGVITRLTNGVVEQRWRSQPALGRTGPVTKLTSPPGSKMLYAMNAGAQRIMVWEKETGRLKTQYVLPSVKDLKDFAVNEAGAVIYVLDGSRLLAVPMTNPTTTTR